MYARQEKEVSFSASFLAKRKKEKVQKLKERKEPTLPMTTYSRTTRKKKGNWT